MSKVIVTVEGGLVQWALLLKNDLFPGPIDGVIVMDFDTEGADGDEVTEIFDESGLLTEALVHEEEILPVENTSDATRLALAYLEPGIVAKTKPKDLPLLLPRLQSEAGKKALEERLKGKSDDTGRADSGTQK
jgi:hypothetical protein